MVRIKKSFFFLNVTEIWFDLSVNLWDKLWLTTCLHTGNKKTGWGWMRFKNFTVENRLDIPADKFFSGFNQTVQVEIKQAERLGVTCLFDNDKERFVSFYNEFATSRKIDLLTIRRLDEMDKYLKLSFAMLDNVILAAHSYLVDSEQGVARLMHSASARFDEQVGRQAAGKVNKLLHYRDMLHFKEQGLMVYDFGGYAERTTDKGLQGINKFKLSFGGKIVACNNIASFSYFLIKKGTALFRKSG